MSNQYKLIQLTASSPISEWYDIVENAGAGLTHDMPVFDDQSVRSGYSFWLLASTVPVDLQTVDGSTFFETGVATLTVTDSGLHHLTFVENIWYRNYYGTGTGFGLTEIIDNADLTYTANPNNGAAPVTWDVNVPVQNTIFVSKNGNDATAEPWNLKLPYLTIEAAHVASTPNDTIIVYPGKYTMTTPIEFDGTKSRKIYHYPGVQITSLDADYTYKISSAETGKILGYGDFNIKFPLIQNTGFITDISYLEFEFNNLVNDSSGTSFVGMDLVSLRGSLRGRSILDLYIFCQGWNQIDLQVDEWTVDTSSMLRFDDPNQNNGDVYIAQYGNAYLNLSGFSKVRAKLIKPTVATTAQEFIIVPTGGRRTERVISLDADFYTMDGPGISQSASTIKWRGNAWHSKSNTLGNEMPFYISNNAAAGGDRAKPFFEHWGVIVTRSFDIFTYLNNTLIDVRTAGMFVLHGTYKNSGEDELILGTPFPIVHIENNDVDGTTEFVFDGIFCNSDATDTGIILINEIGNFAANPIKPIFLTCLIVCGSVDKGDPIYSTTGNPVNIYVYHSLLMNGAIQSGLFPNAMSTDRLHIDTNATYTVVEYA